MKSSHVLALKFIIEMKDNKDIEWLEIFDPKYSNWEYFYEVSGFFSKKYFHVRFSKYKNYDVDKIEINKTTNCTQEINQILESL